MMRKCGRIGRSRTKSLIEMVKFAEKPASAFGDDSKGAGDALSLDGEVEGGMGDF